MMRTDVHVCFVRLFFFVLLVSVDSSNPKHELRSTTNLIEFQPSSSDRTNITIEADCLRSIRKLIVGRCGEPGNEVGQNPSFSNITWKYAQLDNGKIFILDDGQLKVYFLSNRITDFVNETLRLNISVITRVDISSINGVDFSECFLFAIKANDLLMMWCGSTLGTVGSSFYPFHYARAMSFHGEALYVAGYDGTEWFMAEVDFGFKAGKIYIKQIHPLALFDDKSVIRPENLADETELYVVNSSVVIAWDPKKNAIRWFRLNITTLDEEVTVTTTNPEKTLTSLPPGILGTDPTTTPEESGACPVPDKTTSLSNSTWVLIGIPIGMLIYHIGIALVTTGLLAVRNKQQDQGTNNKTRGHKTNPKGKQDEGRNNRKEKSPSFKPENPDGSIESINSQNERNSRQPAENSGRNGKRKNISYQRVRTAE